MSVGPERSLSEDVRFAIWCGVPTAFRFGLRMHAQGWGSGSRCDRPQSEERGKRRALTARNNHRRARDWSGHVLTVLSNRGSTQGKIRQESCEPMHPRSGGAVQMPEGTA